MSMRRSTRSILPGWSPTPTAWSAVSIGLSGLVSSRGITVVHGAGSLTSLNGRPAVTVGDQLYQAPNLVLSTGSYARSLPGLEIDGSKILTSEQALRLERLPASVIVLGGGVIGVEFASAWRSFGVKVTIVEALPRLVSGEDSAISAALERAFRKREINVVAGAAMSACQTTESGVRVELADGQQLEAELMLVAVGRGPQTAGLGYQEAGVDLDDGFVRSTSGWRHRSPVCTRSVTWSVACSWRIGASRTASS